ncbi:hypothetical protein ACTXG6_16145 [Pseudonocardia sp. Cha107L01]|jgi:hypothetical protein
MASTPVNDLTPGNTPESIDASSMYAEPAPPRRADQPSIHV